MHFSYPDPTSYQAEKAKPARKRSLESLAYSNGAYYGQAQPHGPNTGYGTKPPYASNSAYSGYLELITGDIGRESKGDPLERFFAGKRIFLAQSVEQILGLIYDREHLKYENIRKIEYDECRVGSKLLQTYDWPVGMSPDIDKFRSSLEKELFGFGREKRMEEVSCWRDISRLKSEFRDVMRDVSQEQRREHLISGEAP